MHELVNWQGKTEDMQIAYDVGINNRALLPDNFESSNLPAIYSSEIDNICDVIEESWDSAVKKADKIDYAIAVCCGTVSGIIDSFWVGEFSLERANTWGDEKVNKFVKKVSSSENLNKFVNYLSSITVNR